MKGKYTENNGNKRKERKKERKKKQMKIGSKWRVISML